jgi:hypothetical protein
MTVTAKLRVLLVGLVAAGTLAAMQLPAQAVVTTSNEGATGYWIGYGSPASCTGPDLWDDHHRTISVPDYVTVSDATKYRTQAQTVYLRQIVQRWDGSAWVNYAVAPWERDYVSTAEDVAMFTGGQEWTVARGIYRARLEFRWYVGSSYVGRVVDFLSSGDFWLYAGATYGSYSNGIAWCKV